MFCHRFAGLVVLADPSDWVPTSVLSARCGVVPSALRRSGNPVARFRPITPSSIDVEVAMKHRGVQGSSLASFTLRAIPIGHNGSGSSISVVGTGYSGGWWNTGGTWANRISSSQNGCCRLTHRDYPNTGGAKQTGHGRCGGNPRPVVSHEQQNRVGVVLVELTPPHLPSDAMTDACFGR